MDQVPLCRTGRIQARSRVRVALAGFPQDYGIAVVRLDDGAQVVGRLQDVDRPRPGDRVEVGTGELRRAEDGAAVAGPVFVPTGSTAPDTGASQSQLLTLPPRHPAKASPPAYVAGVGMTPFGRQQALPEELAAAAVLEAIDDAGLDPPDVDALVVGSAFLPPATGQRVLRHLPLRGIPVINVENACASGTTALAEAVVRIRAGAARVVVAVGVDAPLAAGGGLIPLSEDDPLVAVGVTLPALYALVGDRYLARVRSARGGIRRGGGA
jgi:Acetyl-CoA acetyltransferase